MAILIRKKNDAKKSAGKEAKKTEKAGSSRNNDKAGLQGQRTKKRTQEQQEAAPKKNRAAAPKKTAAAAKTAGTPKRSEASKRSETSKRGSAVTRTGKGGKALRVIPIGGLNEIGKNMTLFEYGDDIMILDCGMSFPDDEMYGIDIVLPDFSYVLKNRDKVRGLILTHGHEDHIGAVPYLLKELNHIPVYGTRLTLGLVASKLKEHGIQGRLMNVKPGDKVRLGCFNVEVIRTTHSIADSVCYAIDTPCGTVFHTGDFKVDYTPVDGEPIDFARLAELGKKGVMLLMADSTNATRPGFSPSERTIHGTLEGFFRQADGRIIIATFSSNVHRVQKIIDNAVAQGRKVAISGRSMVNVVNIASELGYLKIPANTLVDINSIHSIPDKKLLIITTGSQGEPMSALARMAVAEHKTVQIKKGDMVILSSTPVPGNEKTVSNVVNKLFERGANVIYSDIADIHVSGHACQEELKLMHSLIKPTYFMPVHGEYRHLRQHAVIAESLGMDPEDIAILENGQILNVGRNKFEVTNEEIPAHAVFVDGLGVGDVGNAVLRDRKLLSESGLIVVSAVFDSESGALLSGPDISSKGFVYVRESEDLLKHARSIAERSINSRKKEAARGDLNALRQGVREELRSFIYRETQRSPVIMPIFVKI